MGPTPLPRASPAPGCRTCPSLRASAVVCPTQPVFLWLLLPHPQQGQGSWGQEEGEVFNPAFTLGNANTQHQKLCRRQSRV